MTKADLDYEAYLLKQTDAWNRLGLLYSLPLTPLQSEAQSQQNQTHQHDLGLLTPPNLRLRISQVLTRFARVFRQCRQRISGNRATQREAPVVRRTA
jgi:hypothetical protein